MGAEVDYAGPSTISPLMWACKRAHLDIIEYLLKNKADPHKTSKESNDLFFLKFFKYC